MNYTGFWKLDGDGILHRAGLFVHAPGYSLHRDDRDTYQLPIDGWYWFDTKEEALAHFNLPADTMYLGEEDHLALAAEGFFDNRYD